MSPLVNLFDTLLEPVFIINSQGHTVYGNEPAAIISGFSARKISRGLLFQDIFCFSEELNYLKDITAITESQPYKELEFSTQGGERGKAQITIQPIPTEIGKDHWIIYFRDVTLEERLQKKYRAELEQKEDFIKALEQANHQLEDYSKNLEFKVQERTAELSKLNSTLAALLDSLGQGFLVFSAEGLIQDVVSKACLTTLETYPAGKLIWDVLKVPSAKVQGFKDWMHTIFEEMLPFEDLADLGPKSFTHSQGRSISLDYYPLRNEDNSIHGIVLVSTDISDLVAAQKTAEREKEHAKMIISMIKSKQQILRFQQESLSMLNVLKEEFQHSSTDFKFDEVFRLLHTLKGGAGQFSIKPMAEAAHAAEEALANLKNSWHPDHENQLKNSVQKIEEQFTKYTETTEEVIGKSTAANERLVEVPLSQIMELSRQLSLLNGPAAALSSTMVSWATAPASSLLVHYNDTLKMTAQQLGKEVEPLVFKNDLPVLPESYQYLFGTFVHLFRNAIDHGIEAAEDRAMLGKKPAGQITIEFSTKTEQDRNWLCILVSDDGAGIAVPKIRQKLQDKNQTISHLSDFEVMQTIFNPQFSTSENVTDISGRGVGLDAVKDAAEKMGGKVWVNSKAQQGTQFTIEVPYLESLPLNKETHAA